MNARTRTTKPAPETLVWLTAANRSGFRRIERLSWGRLARIYNSKKATPAVKRAIERHARRCGYERSMKLYLSAWY